MPLGLPLNEKADFRNPEVRFVFVAIGGHPASIVTRIRE